MEFEARPEPPTEHAEALRAALSELELGVRGPAQAYESVWRLAGLLENVGSETPFERFSRSNDGASRA